MFLRQLSLMPFDIEPHIVGSQKTEGVGVGLNLDN